MPPVWCSLPTDQNLYSRPQPIEGDPGTIELDDRAQCTCGTKYDPSLPTSRIPCVVYGLLKAVNAKIQVQKCRTCDPRRRKFIGPDGRERGLFNWSNQILFTHDLLDDYTSAYTTSETPFSSWEMVIDSRYETYRSPHPFVRVGTFRSAWFAFVQLQDFSNDMTCAICGPSPEDVIWDGVTIAFDKKKILPSLQPTTTTSTDSPVRENIRYHPNQQLIADREVRQHLVRALASHQHLRKQDGDVNSHTNGAERDATAQMNEHSENVRVAEERLKQINTGLGAVFARELGSGCRMAIAAPAYIDLFRQVSIYWIYIPKS